MKDPDYSKLPYPYPVGDPKQQIRSPRDTLVLIIGLVLVFIVLVIVVNVLR